MSMASTVQGKRRGPKPAFPGLVEDAKKLGVSRFFLYQVLKGRATSAPLLARYRALKNGKVKCG